jgi:hypothetical protein
VRLVITLPILIGALALSSPSQARDITLHKMSVEQIKSACEKAGGSFSQDKGGYGCGTNCLGGPGTDCIVNCKTDQKCVAQVIGGRRPHNVVEALRKPERHRR